jgi:hypothetical protein
VKTTHFANQYFSLFSLIDFTFISGSFNFFYHLTDLFAFFYLKLGLCIEILMLIFHLLNQHYLLIAQFVYLACLGAQFSFIFLAHFWLFPKIQCL